MQNSYKWSHLTPIDCMFQILTYNLYYLQNFLTCSFRLYIIKQMGCSVRKRHEVKVRVLAPVEPFSWRTALSLSSWLLGSRWSSRRRRQPEPTRCPDTTAGRKYKMTISSSKKKQPPASNRYALIDFRNFVWVKWMGESTINRDVHFSIDITFVSSSACMSYFNASQTTSLSLSRSFFAATRADQDALLASTSPPLHNPPRGPNRVFCPLVLCVISV